MQKRIYLSVLTAAMAVGLQAVTLTPDQALARVKGDSSRLKGAGAHVGHEVKLINTTVASDGLPAVYLFGGGDDSGCMIVSADDVAVPLLGYTEAPANGEIPPQLSWWLEQYAMEIEHGRLASPVRKVEKSQVASAAAQRKPIAPQLATTWDQGAPYNNECPPLSGSVVSNGKAPTGCVATALAQVMKYFNWPEKGVGTGTATLLDKTELSMDLNVTFKWDDMLNSYSGSYTKTQGDAVATLMKACGYAVKMDYTPSGSGAQSVYVPSALIDNFGYNSSAHVCFRDYYGRSEWEDMIYDNLENLGPVIYMGASNIGGGHAFVCDGYSSDGYFHFNWGWSGDYDGYYLLTALNPEGEGIGGFAGGYNLSQQVVLGVCKPGDASVEPEPFRFTLAEPVTAKFDGTTLALSGAWYNLTNSSARFVYGVKFERVESAGKPDVQYINLGEQSLTSMSGWGSISIPYSYYTNYVKLTDGTYKISLVTSENASTWYGAYHSPNVPDYALLTKSGTDYTIANVSTSSFSISDVRLLSELYYGKAAKMSLRISNESEQEIVGAVAPVLLKGNIPVAEGECVFLDLMPGESVEQTMVFTLQYTSAFQVGTAYDLSLYNPCDNSVYCTLGKETVSAVPATTSLSCTSFTIDGSNPVTDASDIRFSASLKCSAGYFADVPMLVIFRISGNDFVNEAQKSFSDYLFLSQGESGTSTATIDFSQGVVGESYLAAVYDPSSRQQPLDMINFTLAPGAGVEAVNAGESLAIIVDRGSAMALIQSDAEVTSVTVAGVDGRVMPVDVVYNGIQAVADLSSLPHGIVVISASDASGAVKVIKLAL